MTIWNEKSKYDEIPDGPKTSNKTRDRKFRLAALKILIRDSWFRPCKAATSNLSVRINAYDMHSGLLMQTGYIFKNSVSKFIETVVPNNLLFGTKSQWPKQALNMCSGCIEIALEKSEAIWRHFIFWPKS